MNNIDKQKAEHIKCMLSAATRAGIKILVCTSVSDIIPDKETLLLMCN